MAGFRNILVHRYDEVDLDRVVSILKQDLGDIEGFVVQVQDWIDREGVD